jgi:hypothetical protein
MASLRGCSVNLGERSLSIPTADGSEVVVVPPEDLARAEDVIPLLQAERVPTSVWVQVAVRA